MRHNYQCKIVYRLSKMRLFLEQYVQGLLFVMFAITLCPIPLVLSDSKIDLFRF